MRTKQTFLPVLLIVNFLLVVFIAGGWGYIAREKKLRQEQVMGTTDVSEPETADEREIWEMPLGQTDEEKPANSPDPLEQFATDFRKKDYKVMTSGRLVTDEIMTGSKGSAILDLDDAVFYFKKGEIVRGEIGGEEGEQILLIADENLYLLDDLEKTYIQINEEGETFSKSFFYPIFKYSCPLVLLLEDNDKNSISWTKISENQWQADWQTNLIRLFALIPKCSAEDCTSQREIVSTRVTLDPETKFIAKLALKFEQPSEWQEISFEYQPITDIEKFLVISSDFKKEELEP